ncbi:Ubiquitin-associated protein 2 [Camelus dromedarius]|uniref:Ubiquitin-associated protein 2 n=1 Tax=Camelus dromedarius TaxID=9838 RepID=A0A5N4C5B2_CAMDR|nr:Ubiquitin-associated protein 2 [Camelus dromedarius]
MFDENDSEFEAKVKQLMEVTGKQDECIVALHDYDGDINKAINILLEGNSDTTSWETVGGKKKNFGKETTAEPVAAPPHSQQPFLNPVLPPGYSYTGLPDYAGVPSAFQYGPTMFVPPASAKQHGVGLNTSPTPSSRLEVMASTATAQVMTT